MRTRLFFLAVSILCLGLAQPVVAGAPKTPADTSPDSAVTTLTSVDAASGKVSLTTKDNGLVVSYDTMGCTITIDGNPAQLSQLHSGMKVLGYTENDSTSLGTLDVSSSGGAAPSKPSKPSKSSNK